jgi:hypothetical protein
MHMKTKTNSLLTVSLSAFAFICFLLLISCDGSQLTKKVSGNKHESEKVIPSIQVKNELLESEICLDGKVDYRIVKDLTFSVGGILEEGDVAMKAETEFKFNTLLFKLNLKDAFGLLSAKKKDLANLFIDYQQALKGLSSKELEKWMAFTAAISPAKRLPELPVFKTDQENDLLLEKNLFIRYEEVKQLEANIESYFYLAPFDGKVLLIKNKVGSRIKPNQVVARIAKKGDYKVSVRVDVNLPIPSSSVELFDDAKASIGRATFLTSKKIGNQKEVSFRIKMNQNNLAEIGQTVYLNITLINQKACYVPKSAVRSNSVNVWVNGMKKKKRILVLKEEGGRCLISGLKDGEVILLQNDSDD